MNVGITGHTKGIGQQIYNYFVSNNHHVVGFSRSNNFDIDCADDRQRILDACSSLDIFVNNAYSNFTKSQFLLLQQLFNQWRNQNKIIINISSRFVTDLNHEYCVTKKEQDDFCQANIFNLPKIINLKPGLTDTDRVRNILNAKLPVTSVIEILDFSLKHGVQSITYGV